MNISITYYIRYFYTFITICIIRVYSSFLNHYKSFTRYLIFSARRFVFSPVPLDNFVPNKGLLCTHFCICTDIYTKLSTWNDTWQFTLRTDHLVILHFHPKSDNRNTTKSYTFRSESVKNLSNRKGFTVPIWFICFSRGCIWVNIPSSPRGLDRSNPLEQFHSTFYGTTSRVVRHLKFSTVHPAGEIFLHI